MNEVIGIISVFTQIIPAVAMNLLPTGGKQIVPWVLNSRDLIAGHDPGDCAEGEAISTKPVAIN